MNNPLIKKDFHKLDVYRFDIEHISDDLYRVDLSDSISWDILSLNFTRNELMGLADFINNMVEKPINMV